MWDLSKLLVGWIYHSFYRLFNTPRLPSKCAPCPHPHCAGWSLPHKLPTWPLGRALGSWRAIALSMALSNLPVAQLLQSEPPPPYSSMLGGSPVTKPTSVALHLAHVACWDVTQLLWYCTSLTAHSFTCPLPLVASPEVPEEDAH